MSEFKAKDFDKILYPVHKLKKGADIFESYPNLLDYPEFTESINKLSASTPIDKVFKYIVFIYDSKSPYVTQISDLTTRKIQAAKDVGFRTNHASGFSSSVVSMLNCQSDVINEIIIRYLRLQGKDITGMAVDQEVYYQLNRRVLRGLVGNEDEKDAQAKIKAQLSLEKDKMRIRLDETARNFLQQEVAQGLHDKLWEIAGEEAEHIKLTPEDYAQASND